MSLLFLFHVLGFMWRIRVRNDSGGHFRFLSLRRESILVLFFWLTNYLTERDPKKRKFREDIFFLSEPKTRKNMFSLSFSPAKKGPGRSQKSVFYPLSSRHPPFHRYLNSHLRLFLPHPDILPLSPFWSLQCVSSLFRPSHLFYSRGRIWISLSETGFKISSTHKK